MKDTETKKRLSIHDIKQALLDDRFRASLPESLRDDVNKFIKNPGCSCNHSIYLNVMRKASKQVAEYFPAKNAPDADEMERELEAKSQNSWQVINCSIGELTEHLRKLGAGRKQIEIARWQDQVTVIVNHLDGII